MVVILHCHPQTSEFLTLQFFALIDTSVVKCKVGNNDIFKIERMECYEIKLVICIDQ